MILSDINHCQVNETEILKAYTRDSYIMECLTIENKIVSYKYDDIIKMFNDIKFINESETKQILFG